METYTAMRHFADSWGLLAMTCFLPASSSSRFARLEKGRGRCGQHSAQED